MNDKQPSVETAQGKTEPRRLSPAQQREWERIQNAIKLYEEAARGETMRLLDNKDIEIPSEDFDVI